MNEETKMILVNTIHFNNNWRYPSDKECTHRGNFFISENETVKVEYMNEFTVQTGTPGIVFRLINQY